MVVTDAFVESALEDDDVLESAVHPDDSGLNPDLVDVVWEFANLLAAKDDLDGSARPNRW